MLWLVGTFTYRISVHLSSLASSHQLTQPYGTNHIYSLQSAVRDEWKSMEIEISIVVHHYGNPLERKLTNGNSGEVNPLLV